MRTMFLVTPICPSYMGNNSRQKDTRKRNARKSDKKKDFDKELAKALVLYHSESSFDIKV